MATFPTLEPSSHTFSAGDYPHSRVTALSGRQGRVRSSNVMLNSRLRLSFVGITEAELLQVITHYQGQQGGFTSFPLPSIIWSGVSDSADYQLSGYGWIYVDPPEVEDWPCGGHVVSLVLETVPPEGTTLLGASLTISTTISGGQAVAVGSALLGVAYSLSGGVAGFPGLEATIAMSLQGGTATGGALAPGANLSILYLLQKGNDANGAALQIGMSIVGGAAAAANGAALQVGMSVAGGVANGGIKLRSWSEQNYKWNDAVSLDWWGT